MVRLASYLPGTRASRVVRERARDHAVGEVLDSSPSFRGLPSCLCILRAAIRRGRSWGTGLWYEASTRFPSARLWEALAGCWPQIGTLDMDVSADESVRRRLKHRTLDGSHPTTPEEIIDWLEVTARCWNRGPTAFVWRGKRQARRQ